MCLSPAACGCTACRSNILSANIGDDPAHKFCAGSFFCFFSVACERTEKLEVVNVQKTAEHVLENIGGKQCIQKKMR